MRDDHGTSTSQTDRRTDGQLVVAIAHRVVITKLCYVMPGSH